MSREPQLYTERSDTKYILISFRYKNEFLFAFISGLVGGGETALSKAI